MSFFPHVENYGWSFPFDGDGLSPLRVE